jgi:hypothetical protein
MNGSTNKKKENKQDRQTKLQRRLLSLSMSQLSLKLSKIRGNRAKEPTHYSYDYLSRLLSCISKNASVSSLNCHLGASPLSKIYHSKCSGS